MNYIEAIREYIKSGEIESENLGLEIEHFIVNRDGNQISFGEVSSLIEQVGNEISADIIYTDGHPIGLLADKYAITLEPSCQFEISIDPCAKISDIEEVYKEFIDLWEPLFAKRGYSLITKGNLPLVESGEITPDEIPLSPKKRYQYMDEYFKNTGKYGRYMMRASASAQVSVDYKSEKDMVKKLRVLQIISPILMIMMESKSMESSHVTKGFFKPHLLRIQVWDDLDPDRTGFFPGSMDPDFGYEKVAKVVYNTPLILLTDNDNTIEVGSKSAKDLVADNVIPSEDIEETRLQNLIEHFFSMGFFHFRIKKYIEVRIADSVPIDKALGYVALLKGIVYSDENLDTLLNELSGIDVISKIQDAVVKIETDGFDASIYNGNTASWWKSHLIELAKNYLPENEKGYLNNV